MRYLKSILFVALLAGNSIVANAQDMVVEQVVVGSRMERVDSMALHNMLLNESYVL